MRGRRPQPAVVSELHRTRSFNNRKHLHELEPLLAAPAWLGTQEKALFEEIVQNAPHGLFGKIDTAMLAAFAVTACLHQRAAKELAEFVVTNEDGAPTKVHPLVKVIAMLSNNLRLLSDAMGLNPQARQRVRLPDKPAADAWDDAG